jgi:hypothetical protein
MASLSGNRNLRNLCNLRIITLCGSKDLIGSGFRSLRNWAKGMDDLLEYVQMNTILAHGVRKRDQSIEGCARTIESGSVTGVVSSPRAT